MINAKDAYKAAKDKKSKIKFNNEVAKKVDEFFDEYVDQFAEYTCVFIPAAELEYSYKFDIEDHAGDVRDYFEANGYHFAYDAFCDSIAVSTYSHNYRTWGILISIHPITSDNEYSFSTNTPENKRVI